MLTEVDVLWGIIEDMRKYILILSENFYKTTCRSLFYNSLLWKITLI